MLDLGDWRKSRSLCLILASASRQHVSGRGVWNVITEISLGSAATLTALSIGLSLVLKVGISTVESAWIVLAGMVLTLVCVAVFLIQGATRIRRAMRIRNAKRVTIMRRWRLSGLLFAHSHPVGHLIQGTTTLTNCPV